MRAAWEQVAARVSGVWRLRLAGLVAGGATAAVAGMLMASPVGPGLVVPGPLRSFHAPLREECTSCHVASSQAVLSVLHGIVATDLAMEQSNKCVQCHMLGDYALNPHAWSPERLEAETTEARDQDAGPALSLAAIGTFGVPNRADGELPCATCHHEHRGRREPLARLTAMQCQGCHARQFSGFDEGHAELSDFPYRRRSRIVFDHATHIGRYFASEPAEQRPSECTSCHYPDSTGDHLLVRDFEQSCAGCHGGEVRGAAQVDCAGAAFLGVPSIDLDTLRVRGVSIGWWPADAAFSDTPVSPFLELLLRTGPDNRSPMDALDGVDLLDLSDASDEHVDAVARMAWAVKGIFADLSAGGHEWLHTRLETGGGKPLSSSEAMDLIGELPGSLIMATTDVWFPRLAAEVQAHRDNAEIPEAGDDASAKEDYERDSVRESWVTEGGWYRRDIDYTVRYRPNGHGDPFMRAWLDLAAGLPGEDPLAESFSSLTESGAVGHCIKCHSIDGGNERRVNWKGSTQLFGPDGVTKFSHSAHFPAVDERGCLTCHVTSDHGASYIESYAQADPTEFTPDFAPMSLATCQQCHSSRAAGDSCLTCHNYHARSTTAVLPRAPLVLPQGDDEHAGS